MSRTERIKLLKEKGTWDEDTAVVGLPKVKVVRMKAAKKEKKEAEGAAAPGETKVEPAKKPE